MPNRCCVVGHPVTHSLSPAMHMAGYQALDLDFTYEKVDPHVSGLDRFIKDVRSGFYVGVSVTVPYKQAIMEYVNVLSPAAKACDAVNTLYFDGGSLVGENTDWYGFYMALDEVVNLDRKTVLIFGAGGAARACLFALRDSGAKVYLTNRTVEKGEQLASEFGVEFVQPCDLPAVDVFVNATSIGLHEEDFLFVPEDWLAQVKVVFDLVYTDTILERTARELGCKIVSGKKMLLYQGAKQFQLFTGEEPPIEVMAAAIGL